jgi:hypothetical protein
VVVVVEPVHPAAASAKARIRVALRYFIGDPSGNEGRTSRGQRRLLLELIRLPNYLVRFPNNKIKAFLCQDAIRARAAA